MNSYGSLSGTTRPPTHPTFALTPWTPIQVRSDIRPPNHRTRPTRLRDLHFNPNRPKTRPQNRYRLGCNLKFRHVCIQKSTTNSTGKNPRFQSRFTLVHDNPSWKDPYPNLQRQGETRELGGSEEKRKWSCRCVSRMHDKQWTRFAPVRGRLQAREEYPCERVQGFSHVHKVVSRSSAIVQSPSDRLHRYDPPTSFTPTISHSIPSNMSNPFPHLFTLASTLTPLTVSVRLLPPSESPSSGVFMLSNVLPNGLDGGDALAEVSATLIAQVGKMKRTGLGWEDKASFLEFYNRK